VLVLDYFTFLKNLQTIPVTDPSVSAEVANGFNVLTACACEKNVEIPTEWYVVLDSILAYFDTPKTFWLYSGADYELFLRFLLCVRNDLFGRKATLIRSLIGTLDNSPADEIEPQQTETNKIMVKSFLTTIYNDLLEGMAVADTLYRDVSNAHNHLLYNNDVVTFQQNAELNAIVYEISRGFHRTIRKLTDLVQSGNIVENLQSSLVSPYFEFPYMMQTRLVESGTLSHILSQYFGNPPKKVAEYSLQHDSLVLFSKKESIWTLEENKEWDRRQRCHYTALLLYHARPELSFLVQRSPPECFLVVLLKEDAKDILSGGYPYKRVFIEGAVQVSKSRCLYGFLGEI
jgi:hypothetical protein